VLIKANRVDMAPNLPRRIATQIDNILLNGTSLDFTTIAKQFNTTYKTICERNRRLQKERSGISALPRARGPAPVINRQMEVFIAELLEREPELYQDEIADYLFAEFEVVVSNAQVAKALRRIKHTSKILTVAAAEQNDELIAAFRRKMIFWDARYICFIDESACNERTAGRRRGWSPRGAPANIKRHLKKSERWSVLPAYSIEGYIAPITFQGSITAEIFEQWLEELVLPACIDRNIDRIIMDNASIHRGPRIQELCDNARIKLEYLPPYTPILNPIENSFKDLKEWIRRYWKWSEYTYDDFEAFLIEAIRTVGQGEEAARRARNHIQKCGYELILQ
jgi:transposase